MAVTSYRDIDAVIDDWCVKHGLVLFDEFGGQPRRFVYTSGAADCFQISIEPPEMSGAGRTVRVKLWSVDTEDDAEIHHGWLVPVRSLSSTLEVALATAEMLKQRPRATPS